jgi:2'-5' RNA ligase
VLIVPEAEPVVGKFRATHLPESVAKRIPPHITLLFPFAPATSVDTALLDEVRSHFAEIGPFDGQLDGVRRFEEHVWLAPTPHQRFVEIVLATTSRFPSFSPYAGQFGDGDPIPHLTVGATDGTSIDALVATAERELAPQLPIRFRVEAAWLIVELPDDSWRPTERFPFRQ